jgi:hypothetical protein
MVQPHRSASIDALYHNGLTVWPGMTIYWIGDLAHQGEVSGHNPDDYPRVQAELTDADNDPEVRALDFMIGTGFTVSDAVALVHALTTGVDRPRLYYVIYNRKIYKRSTGFRADDYTGVDPHINHVHVSGYSIDDENGADWRSVLALQEDNMGDVFYRVQSTDVVWNGQVYVSNRIHRRKLRNPGSIQTPAKAGATEVLLTDALRGTDTWEVYLDAVAGPLFPELVCNCSGGGGDHTHELSGSTGPVTPSS